MRRREFITLVGGAAAVAACSKGQQGGGVRRIGILLAADDAEFQTRAGAFLQ